MSLRALFLADRDARNPGYSGGDQVMWEYARYLVSAGHAVTVMTSSFPGAPSQESVHGIRVVRRGRLLTLWLTTLVYYWRHGRGRYDIVVAAGFGGSRIPRFAPLYIKEPLVTEWHQVHTALFAAQFPKFMQGPLNMLERVTARIHRKTLVRAGTVEWQRDFQDLGFRRENIFVAPVTIPDRWLEVEPRHVTEPNIVWLGRFLQYKCVDHVVRAMAIILRTTPHARLRLAGRHTDRRYELRLQRLVNELGIARSVDFQFDLSEEQKRTVLMDSRVMALPSSVEGFGIVVLEAGACGVPVVASSGVPEGAVADGINGVRYPFGDVNALAAQLGRLLNDDSLYASLSKSAVRFARQHAWAEHGPRYERVLLGAANLEANLSGHPQREVIANSLKD